LHEVEGGLQRWKEKVKILEREFDEKLNNRMKIAIATSILPVVIQDHVFQTVDDSTTFENMMAKVSAWVSNRVAMEGVPMDVGQVENEEWWSEEWEVDAVGAWTQCHNCRGYGHLAKDCPSKKGKGKGHDKGSGKGYSYGKGGKGFGKDFHDKGGFKGYDKGGGKGYSYGKGNGYGKGGKGYLGTCFACGRVGHKAAECRSVHNVEEELPQQEQKTTTIEEVSVGGGVWVIGAVETEWERPRVKSTCMPRTCSKPPGLELANMFKDLDCDDGEYDEPDACNPEGGNGGIVGDSTELARGTCPPEYSYGGLRGTAKTKYPCEAAEGSGTSPVAWRSSNGTPPGRSGRIGARAKNENDYDERLKKTLEDHMRELHAKVGTAKLCSDTGECGEQTLTTTSHQRGGDGHLRRFGVDSGECLKEGHYQDLRGASRTSDRMPSCVMNSCVSSRIFGVGSCHCRMPVGISHTHLPMHRNTNPQHAECYDVSQHVGINAVESGGTRRASMKFHVAAVQRPLASAVKVVEAGNRIVMSSSGSFIENERTGERMPLRTERGTFVFDVTYVGGQRGTITLDSGAGVNVWPESLLKEVPTGPPEAGLKMTAANGTSIPSKGTKVIEFSPVSGGSRHA
jgi:hypothetical protein